MLEGKLAAGMYDVFPEESGKCFHLAGDMKV